MSPLKSLIESSRGWDSGTFGTYAASEYFLNVFFFFLIFAGIILDKMGIRFTGLLSASLMVIGASIKFVGISDWFQTTAFNEWLNSWWVSFPGSAKMASLGFMIFGCGCEMAGTTVSKPSPNGSTERRWLWQWASKGLSHGWVSSLSCGSPR